MRVVHKIKKALETGEHIEFIHGLWEKRWIITAISTAIGAAWGALSKLPPIAIFLTGLAFLCLTMLLCWLALLVSNQLAVRAQRRQPSEVSSGKAASSVEWISLRDAATELYNFAEAQKANDGDLELMTGWAEAAARSPDEVLDYFACYIAQTKRVPVRGRRPPSTVPRDLRLSEVTHHEISDGAVNLRDKIKSKVVFTDLTVERAELDGLIARCFPAVTAGQPEAVTWYSPNDALREFSDPEHYLEWGKAKVAEAIAKNKVGGVEAELEQYRRGPTSQMTLPPSAGEEAIKRRLRDARQQLEYATGEKTMWADQVMSAFYAKLKTGKLCARGIVPPLEHESTVVDIPASHWGVLRFNDDMNLAIDSSDLFGHKLKYISVEISKP